MFERYGQRRRCAWLNLWWAHQKKGRETSHGSGRDWWCCCVIQPSPVERIIPAARRTDRPGFSATPRCDTNAGVQVSTIEAIMRGHDPSGIAKDPADALAVCRPRRPRHRAVLQDLDIDHLRRCGSPGPAQPSRRGPIGQLGRKPPRSGRCHQKEGTQHCQHGSHNKPNKHASAHSAAAKPSARHVQQLVGPHCKCVVQSHFGRVSIRRCRTVCRSLRPPKAVPFVSERTRNGRAQMNVSQQGSPLRPLQTAPGSPFRVTTNSSFEMKHALWNAVEAEDNALQRLTLNASLLSPAASVPGPFVDSSIRALQQEVEALRHSNRELQVQMGAVRHENGQLRQTLEAVTSAGVQAQLECKVSTHARAHACTTRTCTHATHAHTHAHTLTTKVASDDLKLLRKVSVGRLTEVEVLRGKVEVGERARARAQGGCAPPSSILRTNHSYMVRINTRPWSSKYYFTSASWHQSGCVHGFGPGYHRGNDHITP